MKAKAGNRNGTERRGGKTPETPRISESEWRVMRVLWDRGPSTANETLEVVEPETQWKPKTVQTLLKRLVQKGVLPYEKRGREFVFHQDMSNQTETSHGVNDDARLIKALAADVDELAPFLSRFVEREKLSAREIDELRKILDRVRK
ncbi:MAG TPA: BlaI/MecI/CopY family transcriptional regulator [Verrucomicrobiales bacterium]|nr:BlaI/MecI/CopY family transcriptional regulator [Verrucomicrobiales bacterium]